MLNSLTERGKILGIAMGHLVIAQIDKTEIAPYTFLEHVMPTVDKLDKVSSNFDHYCCVF